MLMLILGLILFIGIHLVTTMRDLRAELVGRLGEGGYKGLYSLVAAIGLALIVYGYAKAPFITVWDPPLWGRHITYLFMLPVFPLLIAAYLPGQVKHYVPHPMMLAVKLWAVGHLFSKGTLAGMLVFLALLAWIVHALIRVKQRQRAGLVTITTGPAVNDLIALVVGLVLYFLMIRWGHYALIGVPVLLP